MTKAAYVLSQGQTRDHACHWPGCSKQVPPAMWGCKDHWFMLPADLRQRIWATYRPGQEVNGDPSDAYLNAADAVQQWITSTYGGEVHEKRRANWPTLVRMVRDRDEARARRRAAGEQLELGLAKAEPYTPPTRCLP